MYYSCRQKLLFALLGFTIYSQAAQAESVEDPVITCSKESNPLKRLVCFDEIAEQISSLEQKNDAVTSKPPEQVVQPLDSGAKRIPLKNTVSTLPETKGKDDVDSFGLAPPPEGGTFLVDGELKSIIKEIQSSHMRRLRFVLENGQVWEYADNSKVGLPNIGDNIVVRPGALGSFYLRKANVNRSFRVKRIKLAKPQ